MYEGDSNRALPNRRRHPLDIASPDVADREHAGQTRLEEVGSSGKRPMRGGQILWGQIGAGLDEFLRVARDAPREPACVGHGTGHGEDVADGVGLAGPRLIVPPAYALEMVAAFECRDFCVRS